jgi:hypothetical protein
MLQPLIILLLSIFTSFHDFHVTHTTLHYDERKETIEVTLKVALDDLEIALEEMGSQNLRIASANENSEAEKVIKAYFEQKLKISTNDQYLNLNWVGKELSNDLHDLFIYFEITNCNQNGKMTSLLIYNSIFTEILPDQANIVLVEFGEHNYNLMFSGANTGQNILLESY